MYGVSSSTYWLMTHLDILFGVGIIYLLWFMWYMGYLTGINKKRKGE